MAKHPDKEIEFHDDAMERFERAAKVVAKSPPQPRTKKQIKPALRKKPVNKEIAG